MIFCALLYTFFLNAIVVHCGLLSQTRVFLSLEELKSSTFWNNFVMGRNPVIANTTAIYIKDSDSYYFFEDHVQSSKWGAWLGQKPPVNMIEFQLGHYKETIPIEYYPLVTVSTELSSLDASVEREVTRGFGISFSLDLRVDNDIVIAGVKTGLSSHYSLDFSLLQAMVCRAPKGGKVQMQVSANLLYFPLARTRRVSYVQASQNFESRDWEVVSSAIDNETYGGAMFYSLSSISRQRCVTDPMHFKSSKIRWLPHLPKSFIRQNDP